jgi:hypothetical protein
MKTETKIKIENYLKNLSIDIDILDYVNVNEIDIEDPFGSIYDMISDNRGFHEDIIYYTNAMEYLLKNDPSLNISLDIAHQYGYDITNVNSEILASLLAHDKKIEIFFELKNEIEDFFIDMIKSEY